MLYNINKDDLYARIDAIVSMVADEAYGDAGSLYDSVVLTEKDFDYVKELIDAAVSAFVSRTQDICHVSTSSLDLSESLSFFVPDFESSKEEVTKEAITNFIVYATCTELFKSRRAQVVPEYDARTLVALNKAINLLKSRKSPVEVW